jgi:DNA-binding NarL/FixJ family response regulator
MSDNPVIRTILADDHELVLQGLRSLLEDVPDIQVVGLAHDGEELLTQLEALLPDVVVMDLQMPYSGLTVLAEIRRRGLPVRVLVLTAFSDGESLQAAIQLEADGFALKTEPPGQVIEAIRQVAQGRLVFPRAAQRWLISSDQPGANLPQFELSPREVEVLAYVAQGLTNPQIAGKLHVSENTVRFHLKNIFEKLGVANRTEAAAWYFQHKPSHE